ncbi:MAG: alpha/beta hydrolase [Marmoricola sp.]|nr:alpha/beta hydrolase [Marmoricola sp.]
MKAHTQSQDSRLATRLRTLCLVAGALGAAILPTTGVAPAEAKATSSGFSIAWTECAEAPQVQCGSLTVPVDWSHRSAGDISVAVARRPADDPEHRIGTLFFNPGGPGDGGVRYVESAEAVFSETLLSRFDLVAMDPRGIGGSTPITCTSPVLTAELTLFPSTRGEFQQLKQHNRTVAQSCVQETGALIEHADTISVARDHEALRQALGETQVSWLGLSYGTQVAANYADLFPAQTRAMVLDAALEHSLTEVEQVADETMAAEESFDRFLRWCRTASGCALKGRPVGRLFDRLVARADLHPMPVEGALRPVTGEDIRMGVVGLLLFKHPTTIYGPSISWGQLSRNLKAALAGDAVSFAQPPAEVAQDDIENLVGIGCNEYVPLVHTYAEMRQRIRLGLQLAPHLQGATEIWRANLCIGWPFPVANPPRRLHVVGVPTLIVHAVHDPSVAYKWAHGLASQIDGSDLLTRTGDGHTSYHTSPCARRAMDRYLVRPQASADRLCHG